MRCLPVLIVLLTACGGAPGPSVREKPPLKLKLLSKDALRPMDRKSREFTTLAVALNSSGTIPEFGGWAQFPGLQDVWKVESTENQPFHLAVQKSSLGKIPGASSAGLNLFRMDGSRVGNSVFLAGWRLDLGEVAVINATWLDTIAVELRVEFSIGGSDVKRQYYALCGDRFALVRLEDPAGRAHVNHYGAPNWTIGPLPPRRTEEEWERAILSEDPVTLLEALVWLGGIHLEPAVPPPTTVHEDRANAVLCEAVRARPGVIRRLRDLRKSPNVWIREAAGLTEDPGSYDPERR